MRPALQPVASQVVKMPNVDRAGPTTSTGLPTSGVVWLTTATLQEDQPHREHDPYRRARDGEIGDDAAHVGGQVYQRARHQVGDYAPTIPYRRDAEGRVAASHTDTVSARSAAASVRRRNRSVGSDAMPTMRREAEGATK